MKNNLLSLDFATLRTLQFVFDLGSFSKAAVRLNQTQSNVSYTINRLRESFHDPLFVREGRLMVPTDRCREIVAQTTLLLETFQSLATQTAFDPAKAAGHVTLSCNHYERMTILPALFRSLRTQAPALTIKVTTSGTHGEEQLRRGECDLLLGPVQFFGETVFKRTIRRDRYVCIMDPENPLSQGALTIDKIAASNLVAPHFSNHWRPFYFSSFEAKGIRLTPVIEVAEYGDLGAYVSGTDLIAIVPEHFARLIEPSVMIRALPFEVPLQVDAFWTARTHQSPLHHWIRSRVTQASKLGDLDRPHRGTSTGVSYG